MAMVMPGARGLVLGSATGKGQPTPAEVMFFQRLPTDPLFYADLTLENIVVGSRYRVTRRSTGAELAIGVAGSTSEVLAGLPCFTNPMQVDITVRNASGSPAYRVFDTSAFMVKAGASAYILQQADE